MIREQVVDVRGGGVLRAYDSGVGGLPIFWLHGTPNIGRPPEPLFAQAERLGVRWVGYDRPGYGGSTLRPGRDVASATGDIAAIADALGIERFALMGHSGGGTHALGAAAVLGDRVVAVVSVGALAPYAAAQAPPGGRGFDWFGGMCASGEASLRAAAAGRAAKERYEAEAEYDPGMFTPEDHAALAGDWAWVLSVVGPALEAGPGGLIDDDLAYVAPWGSDPADITAPVLLVHGGLDRVVPSTHGQWLAAHCPTAELRLSPDDGHISILRQAHSALDWLHTRFR